MGTRGFGSRAKIHQNLINSLRGRGIFVISSSVPKSARPIAGECSPREYPIRLRFSSKSGTAFFVNVHRGYIHECLSDYLATVCSVSIFEPPLPGVSADEHVKSTSEGEGGRSSACQTVIEPEFASSVGQQGEIKSSGLPSSSDMVASCRGTDRSAYISRAFYRRSASQLW